MPKFTFLFPVVAVAVLALNWMQSTAQAGIVHFSGAVQPTSLREGAYENSEAIHAFTEQLNYQLQRPLMLDITSPGTYGSYSSLAPQAVMPQAVNSYLLHFDPVSPEEFQEGQYGPVTVGADGSLTFSETILGLLVMDDSLDGTDDQFAMPGTTYPGGEPRGLELSPFGTGDSVSLSQDMRTLIVRLTEGGGLDQIRVITAADGPPGVPEPASLILLALAGLPLMIRRRSRA